MTAVAPVPVRGLTSVPPPGLRVVSARAGDPGWGALALQQRRVSFLCSGPASRPPLGEPRAAPEPLQVSSTLAAGRPKGAAEPAELHS